MIITKLLGLSTFFANKKATIAILAIEMAILAYAIVNQKDKKDKKKKYKRLTE